MTTPGMIRALTALTVFALAACSNVPPGGGGLHVIVKLESGVKSRCVKVSATDGVTTRTTDKMPVGTQAQLDVAIVANGMGEPVTVQALGFLAEDCSGDATETSEALDARFGVPPTTLTLTLRPATGTDGGSDGGADAGTDAGTDAGLDAGTDGGLDAGTDAGVDFDLDGYVLPFDCDDTNAQVHPGQVETSCSNRVDDNCDTLVDCADLGRCSGQQCATGGTCVGTTCMTATELCDDGADNDGDTKVDCADPDCAVGATCNDGDPCTTGDTCATDAGCGGSGSVSCSMPPNTQCWVPTGACFPDAGSAWCDYTPRANGTACNDNLNCTSGESCTGGTCGGGTQLPCNSPPVCRGAGACSEATSACVYPPLAAGTGACTDGNNCTLGDSCDGDGGCAPGTPVNCAAPTQCHAVVPNVCETDGGCTFSARVGVACDAGTGGPAACNSAFTCVPQATTLFPFVPSNFTEADLPSGAGTAVVVSCPTTIDTSGTPSVQGGCVTLPPYTLINQPLGGQAVLFRVPSLTVSAFQTLTITGTRPAIFAVTGNIDVVGTIRARAAGGAAGDCGTQSGTGGNGNGDGSGNGLGGGGGGGFGSVGLIGGTSGDDGAGAGGATNGNVSLIPLRGGCNGGTGGTSTSAGGVAGGALQLVAAGSLTITGVVTAPGRGGSGGNNNGDGGGGGGSGGGLLLEGNTVVFNLIGRLTANGGAGGEGHGASGSSGKDGPDATEIVSTGVFFGTGNTGTGGNGGDGAGQSTPATAGVSRPNNDGAGGGGGGLGRIKVRGILSCTMLGVSSPTATTDCP